MAEIATAYVSLVPSFAGGGAAIAGQLGAPAAAAGVTAGDKASKGFGSRFVGGLKGIASRMGPLFAVGGALAVGGLIKSAVDLEAQFSKTFNTLQAATGAPAAQIEKLRGLAIKMGADTAFSASDAADAMLELAKSGLSPATIQAGALKGTLTLAAAGELDMAAAAGVAGNALNTFSLRGKDMGQVAAALAGGANASTASVESMAQALAQVGPGASDAGLSIQETTAALAAFDNAGIKGSDAGTSLKTMLARLVPSTEKAAGEMEALGLKFTNSRGEFVSLEQMAGRIQTAFHGLSDAERTTAMNTIFGSDARRAATIMMREGAGGIRKYITATSDQNAAQKMAQASMKGTAGAIERMRGSLETAQLVLGQALKPVTIAAANAIGSLADKVSSALPGISAAFGSLFGFFSRNKTTILVVAGVIASVFIPHLVALGVASTMAKTKIVAAWITTKAKAVWAAAAHSVAVVKMIAQWALLGTKAAAHAAKVAAAWVLTAGKAATAAVASTASAVGKMVAKWVLLGARALAQAARVAAAWLISLGPIGIVIAAVVGLVALIIAKWDTIKKVTAAVWGWMKSATAAAWNGIKAAVSAVANAIKSVITAVWNGIKAITSSVWNAIQGAITGAINTIKSIIGGIGAVVGVIGGAFGRAKDAALNKLGELLSWVGSLPGKIVGALAGLGSALWDAGVGIIQGLIDGIGSMAGRVVDALVGILPAPLQKFAGMLGLASPSKVFAKFGRDTIRGFIKGIDESRSDVRSSMSALAQDIRDFGQQHLEKVIDAAEARRDKALERAEAFQERVLARAERAQDKAKKDLPLTAFYDEKQLAAQVKAMKRAANEQFKRARHVTQNFRDYAADVAREFKNAYERRVVPRLINRDELDKRIKEAVDARNDLRKAREDLRRSIRDTLTDQRDLFGSAFENILPDPGAVLGRMQDNLKALVTFHEKLRTLTRKGFKAAIVEQIAAQGIEGGTQMAEVLAKSKPRQVKAMNATFAAIGSQANLAGAHVANAMHGTGIKAADGLVRGLRSRRRALVEEIERLGEALVRSIKRQLRVRSPSQVFAGIGDNLAAGLAVGIDRTRREATDASARLASAVTASAQLGTTRLPRMATSAVRGSDGAAAVPNVRVWIGERELTDIVRVQVDEAGTRQARAFAHGRRS